MDQARIDELASKRISRQSHFIEGRACSSDGGGHIEVLSPRDGAKLTTIAAGNQADIDRAVDAARSAYEGNSWSSLAPAARKSVLLKLSELIRAHAEELAVLGVRDNGTEISMAMRAEPASAATTFQYYAESIDKVYGEIAPTGQHVLGLVERQPVGVVGVIVPWNFPLMIAAWKLAPALAVGNSVVVKPAETASLTILKLAELARLAGVPEGVLNVVTGSGEEAGAALALHNDVDVLAFTGSGMVGRKLLEYSARSNLKPVYLELGGKSPHIIFDDTADLEKAAVTAAHAVFRNNGQVCIAGSRLLVQRGVYNQVLEILQATAERYRVGDPLDLNSDIGAINSEQQLQKNLASIVAAKEDGANLLTGGEQILGDSGGYYMQPTIFTDVASDMGIASEEIFGPVLGVMEFDEENHAIEVANDSKYGLAAGVWTANLSRAHRMVRAIDAGIVHVNCYGGTDITVPMGGMKQSGNGYDKSLHALDKYSTLKTAWMALT